MSKFNNFKDALWIETRKALRSPLPLVTSLGFLLIPAIGALFMIILRDPEFARKLGLISAKAQLVGGSADWPTLLSMLSQAVGIGGVFLFGLNTAWVFGRELAEGTAVDWLATPMPRSTMLLAKFILVAVWSLLMTAIMLAAGLAVGALLKLPLGSPGLLAGGALRVFVTAMMVIVLSSAVAWAASAGRGYLPAMGFMFLAVVLAQVIAVLGWGEYFPWSIPALYSGMVPGVTLPGSSYWIVALTGLLGVLVTLRWWYRADQS